MRVETGCTVTITCKIVYLYSTVYAQAKIFSSESYLLLNKNASSWHIHKGDENAHVQQAPQVQVPTLRFAHLRPPPPRRHTYATTHTPRPQLRDSGEDGVQGRLGLAQLLKGGGLGLRAQGKVKGLHLTTFKQA